MIEKDGVDIGEIQVSEEERENELRWKKTEEVMWRYFTENEVADERFCGGEEVKLTVLEVLEDLYSCDGIKKEIKNPNAIYNYIRTAVEKHFNASAHFPSENELKVKGILLWVKDKEDRMFYAKLKTEEDIKKILLKDEE